mgnify:FL=1
MIETVILKYLTGKMKVPVSMEKTDKTVKRYVLMEKTGSSRSDFINTATIVFQSYAESRYEAAKLNEELITNMDNIIELSEISKSALNSDYDYTDTQTKEYRYQAVYNIVY